MNAAYPRMPVVQTPFRYHADAARWPPPNPPHLELQARSPEGSRSARRMRREGLVPGVIYGGGEDPQPFTVDARILRNTLAHAAQVIEVAIERRVRRTC